MPIVLIKRASGKAALVGALPSRRSGNPAIDLSLSLSDDDEVGGRAVRDWQVGVHELSDDVVDQYFPSLRAGNVEAE